METSGRTNIKIVLHVMPWEIDMFEQFVNQLRKSVYYLPNDVNIILDVTLNLSDYFIDWDKSRMSKEFFDNKFYNILKKLTPFISYKTKVIDCGVYGHLNAQRDAVDIDTNYYILSTPDIIFDEKLLAYYCEAIKSVKNEYFLITPQITKMWDNSWDMLVNDRYQNIPYETYIKKSCFDIIHDQNNSQNEVKLKPLPTSKFAGWFDICNKAFYEKLVPVWPEWEGYGGWDYYSLMVSDVYKKLGGDFQQYLLEEQVIVEWYNGEIGHDMVKHYKDMIVKKETPNAGEIFKQNVIGYVEKRIGEIIKELGK